jgi:hypothetical protein
MAKIGAMPSMAIIDGFRGVIDYYERDGVACVRSWPRWKLTKRAPAVEAQTLKFAYANAAALALPAYVIATWQFLAKQSNLTWRDWLVRAYLGGTLTAPGMPPL